MRQIEVELPVCPECERVGLTPNMQRNMRTMCVGPRNALHKRRKMVYMTFRMVTNGEVQDAAST